MERTAEFGGFLASFRSGRLEKYDIPLGMPHADAVALLDGVFDIDSATSLSKGRTRPARTAEPILKEHAEGLKLLLSPSDEVAVAGIEAEAAVAELAKRGIPRETVERVRGAYEHQLLKSRWGLE